MGVAVFCHRDGKFLMIRRGREHRPGYDTWSVPGGALERGEGWQEAAEREVFEETGLKIHGGYLRAATNDIMPGGEHWVTLWIAAWVIGGVLVPSEEAAGFRWCTMQDLPQPLFQPCWDNYRAARVVAAASAVPT